MSKNKEPILSICYMTYNQSEILKKRLDEISAYTGDDIEVVVSDDGSTEPIKSLVESYHDNRFRYVLNEKKHGLDSNLLNALENCKAPYIYQFRTKDNVLPDAIPKVINTIREHPDTAYFYFSCVDDLGNKLWQFDSHYYTRGEETFIADGLIITHPSGNLYKRSLLNIELYRKFINNCFTDGESHVGHMLIRTDISSKADMFVSDEVAWMYAKTMRIGGLSVNNRNNNVSMYDISYVYRRFQCQFEFIANQIDKTMRVKYLIRLIDQYTKEIFYLYNLYKNDTSHRNHYAGSMQSISYLKERKKVYRMVKKMSNNLNTVESKKLKSAVRKYMDKYMLMGLFWLPIRRMIQSNEKLNNLFMDFRFTKKKKKLDV